MGDFVSKRKPLNDSSADQATLPLFTSSDLSDHEAKSVIKQVTDNFTLCVTQDYQEELADSLTQWWQWIQE
jgi:hypothetical protein